MTVSTVQCLYAFSISRSCHVHVDEKKILSMLHMYLCGLMLQALVLTLISAQDPQRSDNAQFHVTAFHNPSGFALL